MQKALTKILLLPTMLTGLLCLGDGITDDLALDPEGVNFSADWWKYIVIMLAGIIIAYLLIRLTLYVLRLVGVVICLAAGAAGAYFAQLLNSTLQANMPESAQKFTPIISGLIGFIAFYLVATFIMSIIRKPAQKEKPKS